MADHDVVQTVGDYFPHGFFRVDVFAVLVHVGELDGLADFHIALVGVFQANDGFEQRGFAHAVGADHTDNAVAGQGEGKVFDEDAAVETLVQAADFHNLVAQTRRRRDLDFFKVEFLVLLSFGGHFFVALQTGLVFGLAGLRAGADPGEFFLESFLQLLVFFACDVEAFGFLLQVGGVVAFVGVELAAVDFANPLRDVVEEVAVVGDGQDGTGVFGQVLLQPQDGFGVEVVGGFV